MARVFSQMCEYIFFRSMIAVLIPQFSTFTHQIRRTVHCEVHVRSSLNNDSGKNEIFWNSIEGDVLIRHSRESPPRIAPIVPLLHGKRMRSLNFRYRIPTYRSSYR